MKKFITMRKKIKESDQKLPEEVVETGTNCQDSILHMPSFFNCEACWKYYRCLQRKKLRQYEVLSREDRIEKLIYDVHEMDLIYSTNHQDYRAVQEKMLKFEIECLEREFQFKQRKNKHDAADPGLLYDVPQKIIVTCTVTELGKIMGDFIKDAKTENGRHIFKTKSVTLAKWICLSCETVDKKPINYATILNCLGKGQVLELQD